LGTLGHDIEIKLVLSAFFGASQRYAGEQHFLIADDGGFLLAGPWQHELESSPQAFRPDWNQEPELARLLDTPLGNDAQALTTGVAMRGADYVAVGMVLQPLGWRYVRLVPREEILAPVQRLFQTSIALTFLVSLLNGLLVHRVVGGGIVRRVQLLTDALSNFRLGRRRTARAIVSGHDEITEATRAFDAMAASLEAQGLAEAALQHLDQLANAGTDEPELLAQACAAFVELGYPIVWVGQCAAHGLTLVAHAGTQQPLRPGNIDTPANNGQSAALEAEAAAPTRHALWVAFSRNQGERRCLVFHSDADAGFDTEQRKRLEWLVGRLVQVLSAAHDQRWLRLQGTALSSSASAILIADHAGTIQWVNAAFERITGYAGAEAVGAAPSLLKSGVMGHDYYLRLWETILSGQPWREEVVNRRKDGSLYHALQTITPIRGAGDVVEHFVAVQEDISELKEKEAVIQRQATHDALTGLANRVLMLERLREAIGRCRQTNAIGAVMFLDLDQFKYVNDSLGHGEGDRLLVEVAERLRSVVLPEDTLARFGGDEFIVVLGGAADLHDIERAARGLLGLFEQPFRVSQGAVTISASIGISLFDAELAPALLIQRADAAMYHAKAQGRNQYQFFTEQINERIVRRLALESDMRDALDSGAFELHYQPQADILTDAPIGVEALIRWRHGEVWRMPAEFIPVAEESGLILALGKWVLHEACRQAQAWAASGRPLRVAVNLSARQFHDEGLVEVVRQALQGSGLPPALLELELTESAAMKDVTQAMRIMRELKALGVTLAIDDFGTGYSNLVYLMRLPVTKLKTDRSFIQNIESDPQHRVLISSVIAMAHGLGMTMVPEGVETERQLALLRDMGADSYQGYLYARPMPGADVDGFISRRIAGVASNGS
jgi:diguanylate cyclase (GGDEF)-like protein/PAS domain S-box-containing protein